MNNKKYHTVGTIPISNIRLLDKGIIDTHYTQIHDRSWYIHFNTKQMLLQVFKSIIPLDMIKSQVNNALHCIIKSLYINILTCILKYSGGFRVLGKLDEL